MVERLPPDIEAKYAKYLQLRQLLEGLQAEKVKLETEIAETNEIIKTLEEMPDDAEVFVMKGFVLVKSEKGKVLEKLKRKVEELELKLTAAKRHEEATRSQLEKIEAELKKLLGGLGGAQPGGAG